MITYLSAPINQQGIANRVARSLLPDVSALSLFSICHVRHLSCVYVQIFKVPQQSRGTVLRRELASEIGLGTLSEVFVLLEQQCFCGLLVEAVLSTNVLVVAVSCSPRRTFTRPGYDTGRPSRAPPVGLQTVQVHAWLRFPEFSFVQG